MKSYENKVSNRRMTLTLALCILLTGFLFMGNKVQADIDLFMGQFTKAKVEVNGEMMKDEGVPPFIVNGITVVPLSKAAEMLNAYTEWDDGRHVAMLKKPVVNMTIIKPNKNTLEVNPTFKAGSTYSFQVYTQVAKVPVSKNLEARFVVVDSNNKTISSGNSSFTIDTTQYNGSFIGNLNVSNLELTSKGEYLLKLQMKDPSDKNGVKYITIGEYVIVAQ